MKISKKLAQNLKPYLGIFYLLPRNIRRQYYITILLAGLVGFLEIFSLSAILIFLNSQTNTQNSFYKFIPQNLFRLIDSSELLVLTLFLFVLKTIFVLVVLKFINRISLKSKRFFQNKIFQNFMNSPFDKQILFGSSEIIRTITLDCLNLENRIFHQY